MNFIKVFYAIKTIQKTKLISSLDFTLWKFRVVIKRRRL